MAVLAAAVLGTDDVAAAEGLGSDDVADVALPEVDVLAAVAVAVDCSLMGSFLTKAMRLVGVVTDAAVALERDEAVLVMECSAVDPFTSGRARFRLELAAGVVVLVVRVGAA